MGHTDKKVFLKVQ